MATTNNTSVAVVENKDRFQITTKGGDKINLDKATVTKYIAGGQEISDQEFNFFFQLCKAYKVNPFLREAYLVKYGTAPATIVLDYKVLRQIADAHPAFQGLRHGIVVENAKGEIEERSGDFMIPQKETLVAGWCEVIRKDRATPTKTYAMFDEFVGRKKDGTVNEQWTKKPVFMITKVAQAQALREAFPDAYGNNTYIADELSEQSEVGQVQADVSKNIGSEKKPQIAGFTVNTTVPTETEKVEEKVEEEDLPY